MELKLSPTKAQLASLVKEYSKEDSQEELQILDIDFDVLVGDAKYTRDMASTPSQADLLSEKDLLGRQDLVDSMAAMLSDPKQGTPFSIGIFGDWGTGKSSFFLQLRNRLKENKKIKFFFTTFNAWEFEHTNNLPAGLAQRVVESLSSNCSLFGSLLLRIRYAWEIHRFHFIGGIFAGILAIGGALLTFFTSININNNGLETIDQIMATGGITLALSSLLYIKM